MLTITVYAHTKFIGEFIMQSNNTWCLLLQYLTQNGYLQKQSPLLSFRNLLITLLNFSRIPGVEFRLRFYLREVTDLSKQKAILFLLGKQNSVVSVVFTHNNTEGRKFLLTVSLISMKIASGMTHGFQAQMWKERNLYL